MKGPNWRALIKQIPSVVQVGAEQYYEVVFIKKFLDDHVGETRFESNQIAIQMGHGPRLTIEIYLHELLHAISEVHEVGLSEKQIMALEHAFYYVLKPGNVFKNDP